MKWTNEEAKASVVKSRHVTMQVVFVGFFVFATIASMVTGCTAYNVEKLKYPVEYEYNNNQKFHRGDTHE